MAELKDWSCEVQLSTYFPITVGQKFSVLCQGGTPLNTKLKPNLSNNEKIEDYEIVILRHKYKSANELFLSTTSWKVGRHQLKKIKLNIGDDFIFITPPNFEVKSVLESKTEMNPPPGPLLAKISNVYWVGIIIMGIALILSLIKVYRNSKKYDRGMLKLNSFKTGLSPFFEFQKQARIAKRQLEKNVTSQELVEMAESISKQLVIFVSFNLNFPLFIFNDKMAKTRFSKLKVKPQLIKQYFDLKKEFNKLSQDLKNNSELGSMKSDLESLIQDSLDFTDHLNKENRVVKK